MWYKKGISVAVTQKQEEQVETALQKKNNPPDGGGIDGNQNNFFDA